MTLGRLLRPAHHLITAGVEGEEGYSVGGESLFTSAFISAARGQAGNISSRLISLDDIMAGINRLIDAKRAEIGDLRMTPHLYITHLEDNAGEFFFIDNAAQTTQIDDGPVDRKPSAPVPEAKASTAPEMRTATAPVPPLEPSDELSSCKAEFLAKRSSGDLGPTAGEQGYVTWCTANNEISSCKAEFLVRRSRGDLGANNDEQKFVDFCRVRNAMLYKNVPAARPK